ncbi:hypothetical protein KY311_04770 [Candidatus Woesearchaeota archaeon]|nr:hypothetical protein [Candidatus Woesearchaeota archaeon]
MTQDHRLSGFGKAVLGLGSMGLIGMLGAADVASNTRFGPQLKQTWNQATGYVAQLFSGKEEKQDVSLRPATSYARPRPAAQPAQPAQAAASIEKKVEPRKGLLFSIDDELIGDEAFEGWSLPWQKKAETKPEAKPEAKPQPKPEVKPEVEDEKDFEKLSTGTVMDNEQFEILPKWETEGMAKGIKYLKGPAMKDSKGNYYVRAVFADGEEARLTMSEDMFAKLVNDYAKGGKLK